MNIIMTTLEDLKGEKKSGQGISVETKVAKLQGGKKVKKPLLQ